MILKQNKYNTSFSRFTAVIPVIILINLITSCVYMKTQIKGIKDCAEPLESQQYDVLNFSSGKSSTFYLFWFIPVTPRINYNEAVDEAVLGGNGDNIIDVRLYEQKQIWILGTVDILYIEGKAIKYKAEKPEENSATPSDSSQK